MRVGALVLVAFLGLAVPRVTSAQNEMSLDTVEELLRMGRTEDAREALRRWWDQTRPKASRVDVQRGLWLRGRLTVDPVQANVDFQRLVVEYPGGPYSGQALLRLAQSAFAAGDSAEAAADVARISREYPGSAVARDATAWLADAGPVPPRATPPPSQALPAAKEPEAQGKVLPGRARADSGGAVAARPQPDRSRAEPPRDTAVMRPTSRPPAARPGAPTTASRPQFAVQLGAFSSRAGADALRRRVTGAGFDARLVTIPGSSLVRVRVGAYTGVAEAQAMLNRLKGLGFDAMVAKDVPREVGVGG